MKTGNQEPPRYVAKIGRRNWRRLVWWAFRRYCLNEDYYRVATRFTGPRSRFNQGHTLRSDAHSFRYYIETRRRVRQ